MVENSTPSIQIDLNEFKLHLYLKNKAPLTLHFDSPSRRFYLSLIALVVNEMKKLGKVKSIPIQTHLDLLILLNESIGGAAGSSEKENLLHRIYTKWKDALPNLEEAPLFKVLGRKKEEGERGIGKIYPFTDAEKDWWANLFEYMGSNVNVRLKFAIDEIGVDLNETSIVFGDSSTGDAWDQFISSLKNDREEESKPAAVPSLPDKPSIAVLPFININSEKKQEYFSDGLAEGIIYGLSRSDRIFVITKNSIFTYKGKPVTVKQVAKEMGVRYVIEGSVQREGKRVRITVPLIDSLSGRHLFSERYDRDLKDLLNLQDEITMRVLNAVQVKLTMGEEERLSGKGTKNLEAYLKAMQANEYMFGARNKERMERSRQLFKEAIALDPKYADAYSGLVHVTLNWLSVGGSESPREDLMQGLEFGKKARALDDSNSFLHAGLAVTFLFLKEYDKGLSEAQKAVSLNPYSAMAYYVLGECLTTVGRPKEAIPSLQKSLRLSPNPIASNVLEVLAQSYINLGRYEESISPLKKNLHIFGPDTIVSRLRLIYIYVLMGREKEARAEAEEVLRIDPNFKVDRYVNGLTLIRTQSFKNDFAENLRKAGLK